ncbi:cytochrome c3 family protein [Acidobacteriota bacterium]
MPSVHISSRALILFFLLYLILFNGCKDKWLRVFVDGVPEPESQEEVVTVPGAQPEIVQPTGKEMKPVVTMLSRHPDFVEKKCNRCHDTKSVTYLTAEKREICFSCHKREKFEGKFIHGPVAVGDCLVCHHPHESKNSKLLQIVGNDLCFKCHKPEKVGQIKDHNREDLQDCLVCHLPHVSANRFFLKDSSL